MIPSSRTLGVLLEELAAQYGSKEALIFENRTLSFEEWNRLSEDLAKGLYELGVRNGDRVALLMSNRLEWFIAAFASAKIGAVLVAVNTWYKAKDLEYVLHHSGARVLITLDRFLKNNYIEQIEEIIPVQNNRSRAKTLISSRLPGLKHIVVLGDSVPPWALSFGHVLETGGRLSDAILNRESPKPDDLMYILYTSGTTARPKGVTLVHSALIENGFDIGQRLHVDDHDRLWLAVPLFFSLASANAVMATLTHGAGIVIQECFDAEQAIRLIAQHRCSVYYGMPVMTHAIYYHPARGQYDLSLLQKGATIGPSETIRLTMELVPCISNVYGSTETYGNCCVMDGRDDAEIRAVAQGKPLPGMSIKIVDLVSRKEMDRGEAGEVCVKGYVTPGYYQDAQNNADAFDAEGYYLTGDLGFIDDEGYFHYRGRTKDMIKTGGINVSPLAVEECIFGHPEIKEVHVVGIPDEVKGEIIMAVIELKDGAKTSELDIITFCKEHLPSYSIPKLVEFWSAEQFPRTDTGKVAKRMLIEVITTRTTV